ncbi:MAG: tRNA preQ1(34) S-adenosylmethionine ribosyltransferase-isomerase QueA [Planctomycetes bacterium]|nr:tRNA preQ1(34) S-adenosylmethionine ribosyltransferase-isomerase QueA [Planctomycetota bacterium]
MPLTSDFDYPLPRELVAQEPLRDRTSARLMVLDRSSGRVIDTAFSRVGDFLVPGDLLVLNDTRVMPFRLPGRRAATGGRIEVLLIEPLEPGPSPLLWLAYTRSGGRLRPGEQLLLPGSAAARLVERRGDDGDVLMLSLPQPYDSVHGYVQELGVTPLPPYIERGRRGVDTAVDREYYQTVYARVPGAVAAPTAGLHFSDELLESLRAAGVETTAVTLHVGPGTFRPVKAEDVELHRMHSEPYVVPETAASAVNGALSSGRRIVAVGTTVVRTLESAAMASVPVSPGAGRTDLFIRPPFDFALTGAIITNFHLPRSTLLMLIAAFAGREAVLAAYAEAVRLRYRFFSYGDAMLII